MLALSACNNTQGANEGESDAATDAPVMVKVLRAKNDAMAGEAFGVKNVEVVDADESTLPEGYATKFSDISGRTLLVDVKAGDYLAESMFNAKSDAGQDDINTENARDKGYVVITDYITSGYDVTADIQKVIDENPGATIYFPDRTYVISDSILTSSDPEKAVSLYFSNFAVLKASMNWSEGKYMVRLGAKDKSFSIDEVGSNYYMYGGIVDGSGIAGGVSVEGGRETSIRYVSMKSVKQGLYIMYNEECESSSVDIQTVNITGCNEKDSIGIMIDGYDNTLTNMRVAGFHTAVKLTGSRNILRNLHMLWTYNDAKYDYEDSVGFWDVSDGNFYDICYPDNFATGFRTAGHTVSVYNNCYAYWYSSRDNESQIGFVSDGQFNSIVKNYRVDLRSNKISKFLVVAEEGGTGIVEYPIFPTKYNQDDAYKDYLVGKVIWNG